jgi:uncharacterized protein (TIGR00661 family)
MARILFTICGVGRGHATRSSELIKRLMKRHEVFIVSYGDAYDFLKEKFRVEQIKWFKIMYDKDRYKSVSTILYNLPRLPFIFANNFSKLHKVVKEFRPDIVISDFDVNGIYIAKLSGLPVITISNMHIMDYLKPDLKLNEKIDYVITQESMLKSFMGTDYFIIMHFTKPKTKKKGVYFFYPIVRENVTRLKPKDKGYFLVYSSAIQLQGLIPLLEKFPDKKFLVVGTDAKKRHNIEFRKFLDDDEFAKKLADCAAFMSHGGLSSMSEAFALEKPMYTFSSKKFYERYYNGEISQKLGIGFVEEKPTLGGLSEFFSSIPKYRKAIKKIRFSPDNDKITAKIEEIIKKETGKRK